MGFHKNCIPRSMGVDVLGIESSYDYVDDDAKIFMKEDSCNLGSIQLREKKKSFPFGQKQGSFPIFRHDN